LWILATWSWDHGTQERSSSREKYLTQGSEHLGNDDGHAGADGGGGHAGADGGGGHAGADGGARTGGWAAATRVKALEPLALRGRPVLQEVAAHGVGVPRPQTGEDDVEFDRSVLLLLNILFSGQWG
jgi:hypothetical protein